MAFAIEDWRAVLSSVDGGPVAVTSNSTATDAVELTVGFKVGDMVGLVVGNGVGISVGEVVGDNVG